MNTKELVCVVLVALIVVSGFVIVNDRNRKSEEKMTEQGYSQVPLYEGSSTWTWRKE